MMEAACSYKMLVTSTNLHSIKTHKIVILIFTTMRSSNVILQSISWGMLWGKWLMFSHRSHRDLGMSLWKTHSFYKSPHGRYMAVWNFENVIDRHIWFFLKWRITRKSQKHVLLQPFTYKLKYFTPNHSLMPSLNFVANNLNKPNRLCLYLGVLWF
jgi:hypothetical protein